MTCTRSALIQGTGIENNCINHLGITDIRQFHGQLWPVSLLFHEIDIDQLLKLYLVSVRGNSRYAVQIGVDVSKGSHC